MATLAQRGSGTPVTSGTTWATVTNAVDGAPGTNPATMATWTNTQSLGTGYIEVSGYNFAAIPDTATLNSVTVTLRHLETNTARVPTVTFQAYSGTTPLGTAKVCTVNVSAHNDTSTFPVTLAQLKAANFKVRATATRTNVTTAGNFHVDYIDVTADYTPLVPQTGSATTSHGWTLAASGTAPVVVVAGTRVLETSVARTLEDATARVLEEFAAAPPSEGSATTSYTEATTAAGRRAPRGTATTSWLNALTAAGKRTPKASTTTAWAAATTAAGKRTQKGTATAVHAWAPSAVGVKPVVPPKTGSAVVAHSWVSSAVGTKPAVPPRTGTATATYTETVAASGTAPVAPPIPATGLVGWWDASQLALADGAAVTSWIDLSGSGNHLGAATATPTFKTGVLNGEPVVRFNAAEQMLRTVATVPLGHIFLVTRFLPATFPTYNGLVTGLAGNDLLLVGLSGSTTWYVHPVAEYTYRLDGVVYPPNWPAPVGGVFGCIGVSRAPAMTSPLQIGQDRGEVSRYWDGDIAEIIVYDRVLTDPERIQVEDYLEAKWLAAPAPPNTGTATVAYTRVPTAQGVRPAVGAKQGSATVTHTATPAAVGKRHPKGSRTVNVVWTPTGAGVKPVAPNMGSAVVTTRAQPTASGKRQPKAACVVAHQYRVAAAGYGGNPTIAGWYNGTATDRLMWGNQQVIAWQLTPP